MYRLIYQPFKRGWGIYSTVTCSFQKEGVKTPEEVSDYIIGDKEYYFIDIEGRQVQAACEFTSREQIIERYKKWIENAEDSCVNVLTPRGWQRECTPKEQVKANLERGFSYALERWDKCQICPDPEAKRRLRDMWIEEANRVRDEGKLTLDVIECEITPKGFEVKGEKILGPERW